MSQPAQIIPFPQRLCSDCVNCVFHPSAVFCLEWREAIVDERWAQDCEAFERAP